MPNSLKYHHRNYLQIEGLNRVIETEYHDNGANWTALVVLCNDDAERAAAEEKWREAPNLIFRRGKEAFHLIGVAGLSDAAAEDFLKHLGK